LTFTVNSRTCEVDCRADTPLLYVLRNDLGLRGTRFGCGDGACGACTVLLDGRPVRSCSIAVDAVAGGAVTTIEAIGTADSPHRVQQAFLDEQAGQCGYCLSGIVMTIAGLLDRAEGTTRDELVGALDEHLCRCGSQPRILRAVDRLLAS
jgi:aerobic-type carbon monoxide dehydrogenase small subunit (CoxS/CutS family)